MKKYFKGILSVLTASAVILTIASCDAARNTKRPTGSLDLNKTYASLQSGESVSYNEMYNLFRNKGYSKVLSNIKKDLFKEEIAKINYNDYREEFNEYIFSAIYSVSTIDDYLEIDEEERQTMVDKYVDTQYISNGIDLYAKKSSLMPNVTENSSMEDDFQWPTEITEEYKYVLATIEYSRQYLNSIKDKETIIEDGDEVDNSYFIDEDRIKDTYESTYQNYTSFADHLGVTYPGQNTEKYANHAIVVKFNTKAQANKYIEQAIKDTGVTLGENTTNEQALNFYISLYNNFYKDKENITTDNLYTSENTTFTVDKDGDELSELGASVKTFLTDNLEDLDVVNNPNGIQSSDGSKSYLTTPFNLSGDNSYYMVLRLNIYEGKDYDDLTIDEKTKLEGIITDDLLESWASETLGNTLVEKRLRSENFNITIYDPVFENQYANSYSDYYDFNTKFNNELVYEFTYSYTNDPVYSIDDVTGNETGELKVQYSVDTFFNDLEKIYGVSSAIDLLSTKYLSNQSVLTDMINEDTISGYNAGIKDTIKSFKRNETSYSKKMGLENYLVLQYGFDNQSDIVNYKMLQSDLTSLYNSYYGEFGTEGEDGVLRFSDNDNNKLFAKFKQFTDKQYNSYYSLDIAHLLISVDSDGDGTYENPEDYLKALEDSGKSEQAQNFKNALVKVADALVKEAKIITTDKKVDAFTFLAKTFNNQGYKYRLKCNDYKDQTWSDIAGEFEFTITAEDLSTIDISNGSNYVEEFTDEVKSLYDTLNQESYLSVKENIEDNGYWKYDDSVKISEGTLDYEVGIQNVEQLTATSYGWHMLYVYNMKDAASAKFLKNDDSTNTETQKKTWEDQDIVVYKHDTTTTSDDYVVYASGYSETEEPSVSQLFIYFMEYMNNGSVTSMRSSVSSAVSSYLSPIISRYTSTDFQTYRLYKQIGTITFTSNNVSSTAVNTILEIKERTIDSYKTLEETDQFYGWFEVDWSIDFTSKIFK